MKRLITFIIFLVLFLMLNNVLAAPNETITSNETVAPSWINTQNKMSLRTSHGGLNQTADLSLFL